MTKRLLLLMLCACPSCFPMAARAEEPVDSAEAELNQFFAQPRQALQKTPRGFRVIALSNLAEYYASRLKAGSVEQTLGERRLNAIVRLAHSPMVSPYPEAGKPPANLGDHGLYLSHLNIILGAHEAVTRTKKQFALNRRISRHLVRRSYNRWSHARSYPGREERWPADQAALLFSVWLFDQNHGATISEEPISRWLNYMAHTGVSDFSLLPVSEVTGSTRTSDIPRGCALSYSVRYMAAFAPQKARELWKRYRSRFDVDAVALAGLREWPREIDGPVDVDSGPIILGVGAAATGLGIGAARAVGDHDFHRQMLRTMDAVYAMVPQRFQATGNSILARSIALQGMHLERWYEHDKPRGVVAPSDDSIGARMAFAASSDKGVAAR